MSDTIKTETKKSNQSASRQIQEILNSVKLPEYSEIPDVGLYLEQVTRFINGYLADFPEMQVTPSMISNYVKLKIVSKPNRKSYSREQIARFLFIALAKTVLSMDNIRKVFAIQEESYDAEEAYEFFRKKLVQALTTFGKSTSEMSENYREEQHMMDCTATAIAHKMYLNLYFSCELSDAASEKPEK